MKDEYGNDLPEKEILKEALGHLSEACGFLFECEDEFIRQFAFVVDSALKLGQVIYNDDDPIDASCDYSAYENKVYLRKQNKLKVVK